MNANEPGTIVLRRLFYPQFVVGFPLEIMAFGFLLSMLLFVISALLFNLLLPIPSVAFAVVWYGYFFYRGRKDKYFFGTMRSNIQAAPVFSNGHVFGTGRGKRYVP